MFEQVCLKCEIHLEEPRNKYEARNHGGCVLCTQAYLQRGRERKLGLLVLGYMKKTQFLFLSFII